VKEATKSLARFIAPEEVRGRVLLMVGQYTWMYMPTVNQPIRISAQQRLLGAVSNADVARIIFSYDYQAKLLGTETVETVSCHKLELTPKTPEAAYGKVVLWADTRTNQPVQAQFYAGTGKLLKTAFYKGYQLVLGKERPMLVEIRDEIREGEVSRLDYSNLRIANTPDSYFTKENLRFVR
jgi:outer membrane lipoprotein-sorting protein